MLYTWTTDDELNYLRRIGGGACVERKIELLKNYIQASHLRSRWGQINKGAVLSFARKTLAALEARVR